MSSRRVLTLLIFVVLGVFIGSLLSHFLGSVFPWLSYRSPSYGISPPFILNLGVVKLTVGFQVSLNAAEVIGILLSLLIYRQVH